MRLIRAAMAIMALLLGQAALADEEEEDETSQGVPELTWLNFDGQMSQDKEVLLQFYAPWLVSRCEFISWVGLGWVGGLTGHTGVLGLVS